MTVTYDPTVDAAFIYFTEIGPGQVRHGEEVLGGRLILSFDWNDRLVGVEVLGAKDLLPLDLLRTALPP